MSAGIEAGGPAFPTDSAQQNGASSYHYEGMSMRDYFASKAMQGILSGMLADGAEYNPDSARKTAAYAYFTADEMLKARGA